MSDRKESSVLFSLRELRTIEEERVEEEKDAAREAEEQRIRAERDAERKIREEEEARVAAVEQAERQAREEVERRQREEQMRLEETERRARVEAQARLEQERLTKEMEIRAVEASRQRPTWLLAAAGLLVLVVGGLGFFAVQQSRQSEENERKAELQLAELKQEMAAVESDINRLIDEKEAQYEDLLAAKTESEKLAAQREIEETQAKIVAKREALKTLSDRGESRKRGGAAPSRPKAEDKQIKVKCDPSDPLCGI